MTNSSAPLPSGELPVEVLNRVRSDILAYDQAKFRRINVDIRKAVSTILQGVPLILRYRERIAALAEFEIRYVDRLEDYANAALYLHLIATIEDDPREDLSGYLAEAHVLRTKLLLWAKPLAVSGIFADAALAQIKEGAGRRDAAADLVSLAHLYSTSWEQVKNMCGVTDADLTRAFQLGSALFEGLAVRGHSGKPETELKLFQKKSFALADHAYRQCRRAISYLLFDKEDVDKLIPKLRHNRGPKGRKVAPSV